MVLHEDDERSDTDGNESNRVLSLTCSKGDETTARKRKRGIIYLSTIPPYMNVTKVREIFSHYGEIGRVFLQPAETDKPKNMKKKRPAKHFTEAWVEFKSKRTAKEVATTLNNTQIEGRKKSKFFDHIWSIKYLPRFKWIHLSERLAYERAVRRQRLRAEIAQAKREANYFSLNVDRSEKLKKHKNKGVESQTVDRHTNNMLLQYHQRETEGEILSRKKHEKVDAKQKNKKLKIANINDSKHQPESRSDFLKSLFEFSATAGWGPLPKFSMGVGQEMFEKQSFSSELNFHYILLLYTQ